MRIDANLKLRTIGRQFMIVDGRSGSADMVNVYKLNDTAAWIWQRAAERDFTVEELADLVCEEYDVDKEHALQSVSKLVREWDESGLICVSE